MLVFQKNFFQPCPENSISPLFARQYEKIKQVKHGNAYKQSGDQYHRIHPLTKAGLDHVSVQSEYGELFRFNNSKYYLDLRGD